jgi:RimJ/RimL family protein N-acetyltransferase
VALTGLTVPPPLETARLRLRAYRTSDLDELAAIWADPEVTKYIGGHIATRAESWARLLRCAGTWPLLGFGFWAVEERASGRLAGDVGIFDARREMTPAIEVPETGWVMATWAQGSGYATEAMRAALAWSDAQPGMAATACIIETPNVASQRVAAKCGYVEQCRVPFEGVEMIVYGRG